MDSEEDDQKNYHIIWGDCGVANFFINLENLKKCNFNDVMYLGLLLINYGDLRIS